MGAMTAWLDTASDVLGEPDADAGRALLTACLAARTRSGLVSRIALSASDPLHVVMDVSGTMFHPGPELWPTARQIRHHPISRYHAMCGDTSPVHLPDLLRAGWEMDAGSAELMRDLRISEHQVSIPVGSVADFDGWVLVAEETFDESVVEEVTAVQRLLVGLDRHLGALARYVPSRGADAPALTSRERVVLVLLAKGCTAEAMARRLHISPRTVHKHQEHLYRKLGVSDRLSAVLAAQRRGLIG